MTDPDDVARSEQQSGGGGGGVAGRQRSADREAPAAQAARAAELDRKLQSSIASLLSPRRVALTFRALPLSSHSPPLLQADCFDPAASPRNSGGADHSPAGSPSTSLRLNSPDDHWSRHSSGYSDRSMPFSALSSEQPLGTPMLVAPTQISVTITGQPEQSGAEPLGGQLGGLSLDCDGTRTSAGSDVLTITAITDAGLMAQHPALQVGQRLVGFDGWAIPVGQSVADTLATIR